jgi:hypothetical protein
MLSSGLLSDRPVGRPDESLLKLADLWGLVWYSHMSLAGVW